MILQLPRELMWQILSYLSLGELINFTQAGPSFLDLVLCLPSLFARWRDVLCGDSAQMSNPRIMSFMEKHSLFEHIRHVRLQVPENNCKNCNSRCENALASFLHSLAVGSKGGLRTFRMRYDRVLERHYPLMSCLAELVRGSMHLEVLELFSLPENPAQPITKYEAHIITMMFRLPQNISKLSLSLDLIPVTYDDSWLQNLPHLKCLSLHFVKVSPMILVQIATHCQRLEKLILFVRSHHSKSICKNHLFPNADDWLQLMERCRNLKIEVHFINEHYCKFCVEGLMKVPTVESYTFQCYDFTELISLAFMSSAFNLIIQQGTHLHSLKRVNVVMNDQNTHANDVRLKVNIGKNNSPWLSHSPDDIAYDPFERELLDSVMTFLAHTNFRDDVQIILYASLKSRSVRPFMSRFNADTPAISPEYGWDTTTLF